MKFTQKQINVIVNKIYLELINKYKKQLDLLSQSKDYLKGYEKFKESCGYYHLLNYLFLTNDLKEDFKFELKLNFVKINNEEDLNKIFINEYKKFYIKSKEIKYPNKLKINTKVEEKLLFTNKDFDFDEFVRGYIEGY